jgi:exonuclease III
MVSYKYLWPCSQSEDRNDFVTWFADLDSSNMIHWIIMGDFNVIRAPEDISRTRGDCNNMMLFKAVIQDHDLEEIPLKGRAFAWSNM